MWINIANYRRIHKNCIYVCLPKITTNPHYRRDLEIGDDEELKCQYDGRGIFCFGWITAGVEGGENSRNDKDIVPLKKHFHCNCEDEENIEFTGISRISKERGMEGMKIIMKMKMMMMYLLLY